MITLYVVRHADALPVSTGGISDDEARPLSPEGTVQSGLLAKAFEKKGLRIDKIFTSPLVRARQTATRIASELRLPPDAVVECEELAPEGATKMLGKFLRGQEGTHFMLVGHEPDLSEHTAWLIGSKRARLVFAKASVACVVCEQPPRKGEGELVWFLTPTWLESI